MIKYHSTSFMLDLTYCFDSFDISRSGYIVDSCSNDSNQDDQSREYHIPRYGSDYDEYTNDYEEVLV